MPGAPFAALEARVNRVARARMANATAVIAGVEVEGIYDEHFISPSGIESFDPVFQVEASAVMGIRHGDPVAVRGGNFTVAELQPDGAGWLVVRLEKA